MEKDTKGTKYKTMLLHNFEKQSYVMYLLVLPFLFL